jgi:hypothetical protein
VKIGGRWSFVIPPLGGIFVAPLHAGSTGHAHHAREAALEVLLPLVSRAATERTS